MKIVTYILIALLIAVLGAGAYFYLQIHKPLEIEAAKFKAGQPEFDRARKELAQFKEREKQETAWIEPAIAALKKGLSAEIAAGKAEVVAAARCIVVNISEDVLFTPQSVTFGRNSKPALDNVAALLKEIKDKDIYIGNATEPVPAQGKGRKRVPAKDARTLAAARSVELVKFLVKSGLSEESLIATAYSAKLPERGFKLKNKKTIIIISAPAIAASDAAAGSPKQQSKPTSSSTSTAAQDSAGSKLIPITPAPTKKTP